MTLSIATVATILMHTQRPLGTILHTDLAPTCVYSYHAHH